MIEKVGVVGGGIMGYGIAEVAARAGYDVLVREVSDAAAEAAQLRLEKSLGPNTQIMSEGPWLYIRTASIAASDVVLETLEAETRRLAELFATADSWLTSRFEDQAQSATTSQSEDSEVTERPAPPEPDSNESSTVIVSQDSP